jgi:ASCH domain
MAIVPGPRVLSIQQPWAWAIASGKKKVENRSWSTPYRGTVFIHASSKLNRDGVEWIRKQFGIRVPEGLTQSAVIAVAELKDVVRRRQAARFGKWFEGPYGFVFGNVRQLNRPVPTHGKLGLYRPSPTLMRAVMKQVKNR